MTMQEYLRQSVMLDRRITYDLERLDQLRMMSVTISAPSPDRERVQASRSEDASFVRVLERIDEQKEKINREIDLLLDLKAQIDGVIRQLPSNQHQLLIAYRYQEGLSLNEIAAALHISRSTAKIWEKKALEMMRLPENPIVVE